MPCWQDCAGDYQPPSPWKAGSIGSVFYSLKQLRCLFFYNRDDATARREVCFTHFFVVLRRAFGEAK
jgi:hypothetical protein